MSFFLLSLFRHAKGTPVIPNPPPPKLSLFVRGIIKSMRETPDQWRRFDRTGDLWIHDLSNVCIVISDDGTAHPVGHNSTSKHEIRALHAASMAYLEGPIIAKAEAEKIADANRNALKLAAERAPFEALVSEEGADGV